MSKEILTVRIAAALVLTAVTILALVALPVVGLGAVFLMEVLAGGGIGVLLGAAEWGIREGF